MRTRLCKFLPLAALGMAMATTPAARADNFVLSFSAGTISGSAHITTSTAGVPGVPGAQQITGITGTFTDTAIAGLVNAQITGVQATALPSGINPDGTFVPPSSGGTNYGFSYDNLFYSNGASPAVCPPDPSEPYPFGGGYLDIYGLLFNVAGGYTVDLWSNGDFAFGPITYGVGDALGGTDKSVYGEPGEPGPSVSFSASPVPEPGSLMLLGTGALGVIGSVVRRRRSA